MNKGSTKIDIVLIVFIILAVLLQIGIVKLGTIAFDGNVPVSKNNTVIISFKADKVECHTSHGLGRFTNTDHNIFYYHNSEKYIYPDLYCFQYNGKNVAEDLEKEYLTLTCQKGTNYVVALKGENVDFYTLRDYNISKTISLILGIIFMLIIESVYLFGVAYYILDNYIPPYSYRGFAFKKIEILIRKHKKVNTENTSVDSMYPN